MFAIRISRAFHVSNLLIIVLWIASFAQIDDYYDTFCNKKKHKPDNLSSIERLGKFIFYDKISSPDNQSCAACHGANVGFTGPNPMINKTGSVYPGAIHKRFGNRKPPSSAYSVYSPIFYYDQQKGSFVGGNFWDGRATGELLGNPAADQALGPFLNPVEQNNPSKRAVLFQISRSPYSYLWMEVFGVPLTFCTPQKIDENYNRVGLAVAAFEASTEVSSFTSKYDYYLQGEAELTEQELHGLMIFNTTGKCTNCHTSTVGPYSDKPLFTDFTYDNLGVPKNPENPFYKMDKVFIDGEPINPLGKNWIDYGLGGYLSTTSEWDDFASINNGKFKVPTLRNVDKRPGTHFPKAYTHNGVFKSLKEIVHFYNTRDIISWPPPEVPENINTIEVGNLGLTDEEEDDLVLFLETLSDGYRP
ncbi:MAG TPA: cytochrome c peroxidase [Chitinispirillaceae bacterium]|nr:cytochrome c peroxidase [Chitinispirillaceae bacterium]